tara:strand:- start:10 stop:648 length:639 start_codon:yes stop_codon:yes gene_type:complete
MDGMTISIFGNKILLEVLKEIKLFSKYNIKFYDDLNLCIRDAVQNNYLVIFFMIKSSKKDCKELIKYNFPLIVIKKSLTKKNNLTGEFIVSLTMPFSILYLEKKIISLLARYEFNKRSLINLHDYTVDKNERKIKKKNLELRLTEKEINFLILFSQSDKPVTRNFILKNVWNYSSGTDTHTVETHIHRLRKKILEKFGDNNFIKNNNEGYYI